MLTYEQFLNKNNKNDRMFEFFYKDSLKEIILNNEKLLMKLKLEKDLKIKNEIIKKVKI